MDSIELVGNCSPASNLCLPMVLSLNRLLLSLSIYLSCSSYPFVSPFVPPPWPCSQAPPPPPTLYQWESLQVLTLSGGGQCQVRALLLGYHQISGEEGCAVGCAVILRLSCNLIHLLTIACTSQKVIEPILS